MLLELHGVVEVNLSEEEFVDKFTDFVESLDACYFGLIRQEEEEDD